MSLDGLCRCKEYFLAILHRRLSLHKNFWLPFSDFDFSTYFRIPNGKFLSPGCTSAGPHFNPDNRTHGAPDDEERHAGDLGNICADPEGVAEFEIRDKILSLCGPMSVIGRSLVARIKNWSFLNMKSNNANPYGQLDRFLDGAAFAVKVHSDFLRYQLTDFQF